jgi:arylsulfatase A-like enzyme
LLKQEGFSTAAFNPNILLTALYDYSRGFEHYEGYLPKTYRESKVSVAGHPMMEKLESAFYSLSEMIPIKAVPYLLSEMIPLVKVLPYLLSWKRFPTAIASKVTSDAINWIKENKGKPFFLWIHYMDAHEPYFLESLATEGYYSKWANFFHRMKAIYLYESLRKRSLSREEVNFLRRYFIDVYDDRIMYIDHNIGRLIKVLESEGLLPRTAVIITSDHGQAFLEHGELFHGALFYEENLRVPLIIWGGEINGSYINPKTLASLIDIPPTIMSILNLKPHRDFIGIDLTKNADREFIIAEASYDEYRWPPRVNILPLIGVPNRSTEINFSFAIYSGNYKYIKHIPMRGSPTYELYNLQIDPKEESNITDRPDIVERFDKILANHLNEISLNIQKEIIKFNIKLAKAIHKVR